MPKETNGKKAVELLNDMRKHNLQPDTFTYNARIGACARGNQWEKAFEGGRASPRHAQTQSAARHHCIRGGDRRMCQRRSTAKGGRASPRHAETQPATRHHYIHDGNRCMCKSYAIKRSAPHFSSECRPKILRFFDDAKLLTRARTSELLHQGRCRPLPVTITTSGVVASREPF